MGIVEWILSFGLPQPLLVGSSVGGGSLLVRLLGVRFRYGLVFFLLPFLSFFSKAITNALSASPTEAFLFLGLIILGSIGIFRLSQLVWRYVFKETGFAGNVQSLLATVCVIGSIALLNPPLHLESIVLQNRNLLICILVGFGVLGGIIAFYRTIQTGLQLIAWALVVGLVACSAMDTTRDFLLRKLEVLLPNSFSRSAEVDFLPYRVAILSSSGEKFVRSDKRALDIGAYVTTFLNSSLDGVPIEVSTWNNTAQPFEELQHSLSDKLTEHSTDLVIVSGWQTELKKLQAVPLSELPGERSPELQRILLEYKQALTKVVTSLEASHAMPVLLHEPCGGYRCEHYSGMFRRAMEEIAKKYDVAILDINELIGAPEEGAITPDELQFAANSSEKSGGLF